MKKLMKKKVNIFGKKISVFVIALFAVAIVSAALISYFGMITGNVVVNQGLFLDGHDWNVPVKFVFDGTTFTSLEAKTFAESHYLDNKASVDAVVDLDTLCETGVPDGAADDCDGITTSYYELADYSFQTMIGDQPVNIDVEDLGDSIKWTIDFPMAAPYDPLEGNGLLAVGLVIALDGDDNGPAFQIHNNDGSDSSYEWGTWLYSPWGPTINDGWYGWHSGDTNTPVTNFDWVEATGGRYHEDNPDGLFTITIDKSELGKDFHWALNLAIGSGFSGEYYYYEQTSVPIGNTPWFDWTNPIVDMAVPNYEYAELMEELTNPFTVQAGTILDFIVVNEFSKMLVPDTYTITTTVNPAK